MTTNDEILALLRQIAAAQVNPVPPKAYLDTREASAYTGISKATLEEWRSKVPGGPRYVKMAAKVLYRVADLDEFMASRIVEGLK